MVRIKNISLLVVMLLAATFAHAQEKIRIGDFWYTIIDDNNVALCAGETPYSGDITIPSTVPYNNQPHNVVSISAEAFKNCTGLTSISIPSNITQIGNNAFEGCNSEIFNKVRFDSEEALCSTNFGNKKSNPLYFAHHLYLGEKENAETTFTVPNNISQINAFAFVGCSDLTIFTLSESVSSIGQDAFEGCHFTDVRYSSQNQILNIDYRSGNSNPMAFAQNVLVENTAMPTTFNFTGNVKARAFKGAGDKLSIITFDSGCTQIGEEAFSGCTNIRTVTIPNSITEIGKNAFRGCNGLTTAVIQTSLSAPTLPEGTFRDCSNLTNVTLSNGITVIGERAFSGCTKLSNLPSGSGLITIGKYAFASTGFTSLQIPATIQSIGENAFSSCANLVNITFDPSNTGLTISKNAFSSNTKLSNIYSHRTIAPTIAVDNPFGKTEIQLFKPNDATGYDVAPWTSFTPASYGEKNVTYYIDGVQVENNNNPVPVQIGTSFNEYSPGSEGDWIFSGWQWKNSDSGSDLDSKPELMPNYDLKAYGYYKKDNHVATDGLTYSLKSYPKEATLKAVEVNKNLSGSITIPQSINITDEGFAGDYTIVAIDANAFKDATNIVEMTLPCSITTMGKSVFQGCTALKDVVFNKDMAITTLPEKTFDGCSALESFKLPTQITTIEKQAFRGCSSLKNLLFSDTDGTDIGLTTISSEAFRGCSGLKTITLPSAIATIGNSAFSGCQNVNMITINSSNAPTIGNDPFSTQIHTKASLYVTDKTKYEGIDYWQNFTTIENIGGAHNLIYVIDGKTDSPYKTVQLETGKPIVLIDKLTTEQTEGGREASDWECEYEIMPNKDVSVNCSLKYHLTYKNIVDTEEEICSDDLFYGQDITEPDDLKKNGFTYVKELAEPTTITESITKMPAADVVYNVTYSLTNKPTAKDLIYDATERELIKAGSNDAQIGTIYSTNNIDFSTTIPTGTNAGDYTVYYKVDGITASEQIPDVKIKRKSLTNPTITLGEYADTYNGNAKEPTVTLKWGDITIDSDEYIVSYENNTNAGDARVIITDNDDKTEGNFTVSGSKTFKIKKADVVLANSLENAPTGKDNTYDGTAKGLINAGSLNNNTFEMEYSLDKNNYSTTIPTGTDAGDYKVYYRVKASDNYNASNRGELTASIKEKPIQIASADIILEEGFDYAYDGSAKKPDVISVKWGNETFTKGTHFTVSYSDNTNVGEATVTLNDIKGKGCNYEISGSKTFTILPERSKLTKLPTVKNITYNGSDQDLINKDGTAENGKLHYSLSQDASTFSETVPKGKDAGNYIVYCKVKGDANHSDSEISSVNVTIAPREITSFSLSQSSYIYDGSERKPDVIVKYGESTISKDEYTVSYTNNINVGTATVTLTDKEGGNFKINGSKTFTITKATLTISGGYYEIFEGDAIPELTVSYEGFKNNETEAVLTTKPTVSCKATTDSKSGEYTINVSGAKADNYNITHKNGKLVIMAMKFESGGNTSKDEDDKATYQIISKDGKAGATPTVAITDDKEVSGKFEIPETVIYYDKTFIVTEIAEGAFENNKNLTEVIIPSTISGIGDNAFKGCVNLQAITVYNTTPINLYAVGTRGEGTRGDGSSIFDGVNKALCILYVPDESVELYKQALIWKDFQHIAPLSANPTGINGITITEGEPFDIYNLQGQKVKSKATSLEGLTRGIYIINGKKVAVK